MTIKRSENSQTSKIEKVLRDKGFISVREASEKSGVDDATIYRWIDDGKISGRKVEAINRVFVLESSLVDHLGADIAKALGFNVNQK